MPNLYKNIKPSTTEENITKNAKWNRGYKKKGYLFVIKPTEKVWIYAWFITCLVNIHHHACRCQ